MHAPVDMGLWYIFDYHSLLLLRSVLSSLNLWLRFLSKAGCQQASEILLSPSPEQELLVWVKCQPAPWVPRFKPIFIIYTTTNCWVIPYPSSTSEHEITQWHSNSLPCLQPETGAASTVVVPPLIERSNFLNCTATGFSGPLAGHHCGTINSLITYSNVQIPLQCPCSTSSVPYKNPDVHKLLRRTLRQKVLLFSSIYKVSLIWNFVAFQ